MDNVHEYLLSKMKSISTSTYLLVSVPSVDLESQVAVTLALIEELKAEIAALEARKEAVIEISDKITKVTSRNYVKRIISRH